MKHPYNNDRREWAFIRIEDIPTPFVRQVPNSGYQYKYNGKEWQDELGQNVYAYGWRVYDPAIGRFNKMDRFSEKYYDKTPYGYAANNPVRINDIQGDSLFINYNNQLLKYVEGRVYKKVDGKYIEYIDDETLVDEEFGSVIAYSGFLGQVTNALKQITSKKSGNKLITDLQNSHINTEIHQGSNSHRGGLVEWDPNSKNGGPDVSGSYRREPFIGLTHELGHAHDRVFGQYSDYIIGVISGKPVFFNEYYAMNWENKIRYEHGFNLRTHYANDENGNRVGVINNLTVDITGYKMNINFSSSGININVVEVNQTMVIPIKKF